MQFVIVEPRLIVADIKCDIEAGQWLPYCGRGNIG